VRDRPFLLLIAANTCFALCSNFIYLAVPLYFIVTLILPFKESLVTVGTIMHGGAFASLIDTAVAVAAWSGVEAPTSGRGTTVNLTVSYLTPAEREDVQAHARVLRRGRSLVFLDVEVTGTSGRAIAKGLVTYKLG
jgi:uncharacterized protein (TIGR00369 family)